MRSVRLDNSVPATKGLAELNHHRRDERKKVRNGVACDGRGLSEEEESNINEEASGRQIELVQTQDSPPRQPQGSVVQWERFLPIGSLKVLLVESDDSTRHVVSALLRNCSYEVTAVPNGLEAWKVLADQTKHIDLVLTEVVMPYLSGIGLLSKIMSSITCKSIPVIMMSSDDSMGIVFNCLSKGAVDFLVKPIRKNELKNLWQHVWRKCHSSSSSGSESGIRTQKSTKSKSTEGSDNDTGSNDEDDNSSISLTAKNGSDNGSDTQSSWSKRAAEVDSSKAMSAWNQLAGPTDSTCAQVIRTRPESFSNYWAPTNPTREREREDDIQDTLAMGKDLVIGVSRDLDLHPVGPSKNVTRGIARLINDKMFESGSKKVDEVMQKGRLEYTCETANGERTEIADLVGTISRTNNVQVESAAAEVSNELSKLVNSKEETISYTKESPALELSLKRVRDVNDSETSSQQRNVLRHSDLSAFSRYNTSSNANQAPTGNVGSCSPLDNSSEGAKAESTQCLNNSNGNPIQRSNGSSNNDDMGSTTNNAFTKPENIADNKPAPKSTVNIHPSSALQSSHQDHASSLQPNIPGPVDNAAVDTDSTQLKSATQQVQVRHHHHHYHHHHHHVHNMQQQKKMSKHDDGSLRNMESNVLTVSIEGNAANYGSASGSNNRSNGENGSNKLKATSSAAVTEGLKMGSDDGVTAKCETGDGAGSGSRSRSGVNQNRLALREAALHKFRQKRKERCFEKKVRYHSRKKLAEQRPRVHGQFVRQGAQEIKNEKADS